MRLFLYVVTILCIGHHDSEVRVWSMYMGECVCVCVCVHACVRAGVCPCVCADVVCVSMRVFT